MIIHIDGDAFFASCEIAIDVSLKGKPVVTGRERGIATALSYEAKRLGVTRGMPVHEIRKLFPQVIIRSSSYHIYATFAQRMYNIVRRYTPTVEEYSIDECFGDLADCLLVGKESYETIGDQIKETLRRELGMTFSVGIGPTKVLAKVASKRNKPDGLTVIYPEMIPEFLKDVPIGAVWGIGTQTAILLGGFGIRTALDFITEPQELLFERINAPCKGLYHELSGNRALEVHSKQRDLQKSIQHTQSFKPSTNSEIFLLSQLARHVESACGKARVHNLVSKKIYYFLKTKEFRYHRYEFTLNSATASPHTIMQEVRKTFSVVYRKSFLYRACGITLAELRPADSISHDLFGASRASEKWDKVFAVVDKTNKRYGSNSVVLGSSLIAHRGISVEKAQNDQNPKKTIFPKKSISANKRLWIPKIGEVS